METISVTSEHVSGLESSQVIINPISNLLHNTQYYIQFGAGVFSDLTGNSFAGISDTTTWNFTTVSDVGSQWISRTSTGLKEWRGITSSSDGIKLAAVAYDDFIYTSTN